MHISLCKKKHKKNTRKCYIFKPLFLMHFHTAADKVYLLSLYLIPFFTTLLFFYYQKQKIKLNLKQTAKEIVFIIAILAAVSLTLDKLSKYAVNPSLQIYLLFIYLFLFFAAILFLSIRFSLIADIGKKSIDYKRLTRISVIISLVNIGAYRILMAYNIFNSFLGFVFISAFYILLPIFIGRLWYSKKVIFQ